MKNTLPTFGRLITTALLLALGSAKIAAQSFNIGTLPAGKTIVITYEVDVNANACPTGTVPGGDISNQSNVSGSNFPTVQTHETNPGTPDPTLTPFGGLTLGNLVYKDVNKDGDYDSGTDTPIDGVQLRLYVDDGNGVLDAGDGAHIATATTAGGGLYSFAVCPGNYIVEVIPSNFNSGNALYDNGLMAALVSSPIGGAPDPDNDVDNDDNGDQISGFGVASNAITMAYGTEPDGADLNTNNRLDFGFKTPTTVTIGNRTLAEGTGAGPTAFNFTVTRSDDDEAFSLTVNTAGGTATSGTDYTAISGGTVSFAANDNNTTATVTVHVAHDNIVEDNETFTVNLSGAPAGVIITDGTGDGSITNDDNATLTLAIAGGGASQDEGNTFTFTATLNNPVQDGFQVAYTTNNGVTDPATAGSDYTDNDGILTFAGNAAEPQSWMVNTSNDNTVELHETIRALLGSISMTSAVQAAVITISGSPQTATLLNDDAATVSIQSNKSELESVTPQTFTITLSNPVDVPVSVSFSTADNTANAGSDYTGINNQPVTFSANNNADQTVDVTITNDNVVEADEIFDVSIGTLEASSRNVTLGTSSRTGTILNDDVATITLTPVGGVTQNEGNSGTTNFVFTATPSNPVQGGFTIAYTTSDGTATTADMDYVDNDGTLTFGDNSITPQNITVLVNGDLNIETNETFTVALGAFSNTTLTASLSAGPSKTGTITNDEQDWGDAPTAAQSGFANSYPTTAAQTGANHNLAPGGLRLGATVDAENDGQPNTNATGDGADEDGVILGALVRGTTTGITVNASGAGRLNAWVDWNRNGSWADAGEKVLSDQLVAAGNNTLNISVPAGASLGTSFARFRLTTATGTNITGSAADGEVEDYQVSVITNAYSISSPTVTEGSVPNTVVLNFVISRLDNTNAGSVDYSAPTGTATAGTDYVSIPSGTINFGAGGNFSETVSVTVNGDAVVEDDETVVITLSNPVNGGIGSGMGTGAITNDDAATLTLIITGGGASQDEGNTFTFTATLDNDVQDGFQVAYTTSDGITDPAIAGSDYTDNDGNLTFLGNAGEPQSWMVNTSNDNTVELHETIRAILGSISMTSPVQAAAITISGSPQTATLLNDDAATVSIQSNKSELESVTPQTFVITLSNPVDVPVSVNFNTADNTANAGSDYTGITNQPVTFPANNNANQTVDVTIANDNMVEADEIYDVSIGTLSAGGRNVTLGTTARTGTIQNNDATTVTLTPVGGVSQNEGNSGTTNFVFTAELTNPVQGGFSLSYTTSDGTATTADNDYVDNDGPALVFDGTANETEPITVQVNGDNKVEANETFTVQLGSVSNTALGTNISVDNTARTGTIQNDEVDRGDAPDPTYPTLLANNGARHKANLGVHLGAGIDGEDDGQPNANADGDGADEDGVTLPGALVINTTANITVNASAAGRLNAWVDFNQNGTWESPSERVFTDILLSAGDNALSFAVPAGATLGTSYARFRFGSSGLSPTGLDLTGEVEDYKIEIVNTLFSINNPSVAEGNSPNTSSLTFRISRNVSANACSVQYTVTNGTATTTDNDYSAGGTGTAVFSAGGDLFQDITIIAVNGDNKVELDETVIMTLSNPVNASIAGGMGTGTGTIENDDQGVITISNPTVTEGDASTTNAAFEISLSNAADANVTLNYATQDGTATLGNNDYQNTTNSLTFTPGQTMKTVNVPVVGDCAIESAENFVLRLSALNANSRNVIFSGSNPTLDGTGTINNDDALPVINCPSDDAYDTDPGECSALITLPLPTLNSICGSSTLEWRGRQVDEFNVPLQPYSAYTPAANNTAAFNKGRFEIEWKVTDGSGASTCSYFIEIVDNELPDITCPGPVTVTCSSLVPPVNLADVTATDNCPGVAKSHVGDATTNMTCANRKTVTRTYRATDSSGNSTTCAQVITVFDNVAPVFTFVPANVTVQCNSVPAVGSPTASDGCGGSVSIAYNGQTVSNVLCTDKYTLTRQWTATDACGNTRTATQRIVVTDTQKPNFTSTPANITVQCAAIPDPAPPAATDNCDTDVAVTYNGQTTTAGACPNAYTLTRRWTAADNCNNTRSISQRITVVDNVKPVFTSFPSNISIACHETPPPVGSPTASDGCGPATVVYLGQSTTSGTCPGNYQIKRTWRATDACGNSTVATQTIQVSDSDVPVFTSVPGPLTIECGDPLPPLVNPTASDACGGYVQITFLGNVPSGSGCAADYTVTRTWRAEDLCGNTTTTTQVITVLGNSYGPPAEERKQDAGSLSETQNSKLKTLNLQPNPTTDRIWLDLTDFAGESVTVSIFSDLGQLIRENRIPAVEELKLPISLREAGAAAGIYTVSVRSKDGVTATRVVLVE